MTVTIELKPEIVAAITEAAARQGLTREDVTASALQRLFLPSEDIATLLRDETDGNTSRALVEEGFLLAVEGTRHVWDTPEEDKAWAHL